MKKFNLLYIPIAVSLIGTILLYARLPEQVPMHWDLSGQVDSWRPRYFIFFTALLPALFVLLLRVIPNIDPKSESFSRHGKAYGIVAVVVILFLLGMHWVTILFSLGFAIKIDIVIRGLIGITFIIIGNYLPQAKQNYTFGIKTPWTLDNEVVWNRTHRFGGFAFVISGIITIISLVLSLLWESFNQRMSFWVVIISCVAAVALTTLYSYLEFRKVQMEIASKKENL
ncbi:MAG: SdpI family protein [Bacteroidetes bacterium]|nr:SdpI family protein [Bacteroidota bacterium]